MHVYCTTARPFATASLTSPGARLVTRRGEPAAAALEIIKLVLIRSIVFSVGAEGVGGGSARAAASARRWTGSRRSWAIMHAEARYSLRIASNNAPTRTVAQGSDADRTMVGALYTTVCHEQCGVVAWHQRQLRRRGLLVITLRVYKSGNIVCGRRPRSCYVRSGGGGATGQHACRAAAARRRQRHSDSAAGERGVGARWHRTSFLISRDWPRLARN